MKRAVKTMTMAISIMGFVFLLTSNVYALKASDENPHDGQAPYGVAVKTDAKGTKLTGILGVEYFDILEEGGAKPAKANVVLRLRQGNQLHTFFKVVDISDLKDTPGTQEEIMVAMAYSSDYYDDPAVPGEPPALVGEYIGVLETFFGTEAGLEFTVKSLEEYDSVSTCTKNIIGECGEDDPHYYLMDVIIAVQ